MAGGKRRRFWRPRFTLAAMLMLITVIALPLGYVAQRRAWNESRLALYEALKAKQVDMNAFWPGDDFHLDTDLDGVVTKELLELFKPEPEPWSFSGWWSEICKEKDSPRIVAAFSAALSNDSSSPTGQLADDDLRLLAKYYPELKIVFLQEESWITDEGLRYLARLPDLRHLELTNLPRVKGSFLRDFREGNSLHSLRLVQLPALEGERLKALGGFKELATLEVRENASLSGASLCRVHLPNSLRTLQLAIEDDLDEALVRWLDETRLERLEVDTKITRAIAPALSHQRKLSMLQFVNAPLMDEDFAFLSECNQLQILTLTAMPIRGEFLKNLPAEAPLESVDFAQTLVTDECLRELARYPSLRHLGLAFTPITGDFARAKPSWPRLESVDLRGVQFSDKGKVSLKHLTSNCPCIHLPENWRYGDLTTLQINNEGYLKKLLVPRQLASWAQQVEAGWYASESQVWKLDRCPADLMAPVLRLHELAREPKKE
jgi:hypothetical protein